MKDTDKAIEELRENIRMTLLKSFKQGPMPANIIAKLSGEFIAQAHFMMFLYKLKEEDAARNYDKWLKEQKNKNKTNG